MERLHEGLKQYEREQLRQWQLAQIEGKKRMIEAAIGRSIHGKDENQVLYWRVNLMQDGQGIGDGEGDKTLVRSHLMAIDFSRTISFQATVTKSFLVVRLYLFI